MIRESLALVVLAVSLFKAQDICENPEKEIGVCVNISSCPLLLNILQGPRPIPPSKLNYLQQSQCGFEGSMPKVCCKSNNNNNSSSNSSNGNNPNPPDVINHPNMRFLNHTLCGRIGDSRIVGGNKTKVLDYPWMALIAYDIRGLKEFRCGGTIINSRYILTAAHCVADLPSGLKLSGVRVGEHNLTSERDCDYDKKGREIICSDGYQDFGIEHYEAHSDYLKSTLQNDIALIRLNGDIRWSINVRPICLPIGTAQKLRSSKLIVTGWGATEAGPQSPVLLFVNLTRVSDDECRNVYKKSTQIWYKQMCAGGKNGKDSCLGDSGGPLQTTASYFGNPRWIQYGVVSFGPKNCGIEGYPGVYTKVSYYVDWLLDNIRD